MNAYVGLVSVILLPGLRAFLLPGLNAPNAFQSYEWEEKF